MKSGLLHRRRAHNREAQSGYIMIAILLMLALMVIALTVAAPKIAQQARREREEEMIHRGTEYARAVKKYYKKFHRYPTSVDQLENTNGIRFLRKKYTDPMNPEGVWRVVRFGEIQMSQQQLNGATPAGAAGNTNSTNTGSSFNNSGQTSPPIAVTPGEQPMPDPSAPAGNTGGAPAAFGNSTAQGGGAMMGVASLSKAKGIHEFNNKAEYAQWFFIYDPNQDRGNLLRGPYNPKALYGSASSIPGALNPNQLNQPGQQTQQPQQPQNNNNGGAVNR